MKVNIKVNPKVKDIVNRFSKKLLYQILWQFLITIFIAIISFFFMTWLIDSVLKVNNSIYLSTTYKSLGTIVCMTLVMAPMYIGAYLRQKKTIKILSESIKNVANGNFDSKIKINSKDSMAQIYENFNKMTDELKSVKILREDFINNFSHEFKTPIASINGFAQLLLEKEYSKKDMEQYLQIIIDESDRLSKLAKNTILFSKLSSQQIITDINEFDLTEQIRQCLIVLSNKWLAKNIECNFDSPSYFYRGNKELLHHLWLNIIDNAVKYTPDNGKITISIVNENNFFVVKVSDTGKGMDSETIKNIFNPYYQEDNNPSKQGLGLGLSISKRIAELCNGTIEVKSQVNNGSCFIIKLPTSPNNKE